jgi:hypothetical protein
MSTELADAVFEAIGAVTDPLFERIKVLEAEIVRLNTLEPVPGPPGPPGIAGRDGIDGKDGRDGVDGKDGQAGADGRHGVDGTKGLDGTNGTDGRDGLDGKDGVDGKDGIAGKDGVDGRDGAHGPRGEKGDPGMHGKDGVGVAGAVIDRDGTLVLTLSDGTAKTLGPVVGAPGPAGKDGVDGLGFDDVTVEFDGERTFTIKAIRGDRTKDLGTFSVPVPIWRGTWEEGKSYYKHDEVTWGGGVFQAIEDTTAKPGLADAASRAWVLKVKRGAPGATGPQGPPGPKVVVGK